VEDAEVSWYLTQDITFAASSASLVFDCPDGRPSAVTFTVRQATADDTSTAETALTGSASVETNPNTTITAAAGASQPDPTALTLNSGTGVAIGRTCRITDDDTGVYEDFTFRSVNGTAAKTTRPLKNDYTASATVVSTRATQAFDTTWLADIGNLSPGDDPNPKYRVHVSATVGGVAQVYAVYFDLVRYPARHGVLPTHVDERFPGWLDTLPPDYQADQGRMLIERAWRQLRMDLYQDRRADQAMRNAEAIAELVMTRAMLLKIDDDILRGADVDERRLTRAQDFYKQRYNSLIRSPVMPVDTSGGGSSAPARPRALVER
jgi:hypothetical protein